MLATSRGFVQIRFIRRNGFAGGKYVVGRQRNIARQHETCRITPRLLLPRESSIRCFSSVAVIKESSVEDRYSRKTPLEHVLLRPSMYVGPNERSSPTPCWIPSPPIPLPTLPPTLPLLNDAKGNEHSSKISDLCKSPRMSKVECGVVPALIKVFDEILVNAADNRQRHPESCTRIDVIIYPGNGNAEDGSQQHRNPFISVRNNGQGIPVQIHKKEGMYVPEMLFGHLLTGSNFDDDEKRLTGGRHGYGAKLTNIFSRQFTVETIDTKRGLQYRQTWKHNMHEQSEPDITALTADQTEDFTCVSFVPDLARLENHESSDDDVQLLIPSISSEDYAVMCRRVLDVAGCNAGKLQVTLNGIDVSMESFADYIALFRRDHQSAKPMCFLDLNRRWTIGVGMSSESGLLETVSFVNGIATSRGGTHVNAIAQQLTKTIQDHVKKLNTELAPMVSQGLIRRNLLLAVNTLIENPTFDSQMKEYLTSNPDSFGSSYNIPTSFLREILKPEEEGGPGIVEEVLRVAQGRQQATLLKTVGGRKTRRQLLTIPKLEDAHGAGSKSGWDCTLILTEGDSAKALAVAGLEVIGRDRYGVFPLRGKFLNVRGAPLSKLQANAEVTALCSIIGLDFEKQYTTTAERGELRYGKVMLMTDQDTDGSHIKGLVMNFFRHFWPGLMRPPIDTSFEESEENPPFLSCFVTPLLKITKKGNKKTSKPFFSMAEYNAWRNAVDAKEAAKWNVKYYKGLGTSTPAEAKEYFSAFDKHFRPFVWTSGKDGELLDMVFDKERAADRRRWILDEYDVTSDLPSDSANGVSYENFINKEMIHFSHADNIRSIPSLLDGLKPSQRKVLYACFKRNLKSEIKVAQLTGYCAEHTAYHHGEASLQSTIIGMAQDFVGSNNINLLVPSGQFGTRIMGGKDAASPRYIFTHLAPVARYLFPEVDDCLLTHREDDGQVIEPEYYCPTIPLLLVNGTQGIGTGWSSFIPPHDPRSVLEYIRAKLDGSIPLPSIRPFVRGFDGKIEAHPKGTGHMSYGRASSPRKRTVVIDELPVGCWTDNYKKTLLRMRDHGMITNFVENHTTTKVSFTVSVPLVKLEKLIKSGLEKQFKLQSSLLTTNMHAFGANQQMVKFSTAEDIADAYFPFRMQLYEDRMSVLRSEMEYQSALLRNKARFIKSVTDGQMDLLSGKATQDATAARLDELGFDTTEDLLKLRNNNAVSSRLKASNVAETEKSDGAEYDYDYLMKMPLSSLTRERIEKLHTEANSKDTERNNLKNSTATDLWNQDLDRLEKFL